MVEVIGVGAPLVDHLISIDETYLNQIPGKKWGMETVTFEEMVKIIEESASIPRLIAGGSACNAIKGLSQLGHEATLIGMIGSDAMGEKVLEGLQDFGVRPELYISTLPTGHVVCLITPDGQRTCRAFPGASLAMTPKDINPNLFHHAKWVHLEGYTLMSDQLPEGVMRFAKEAGAKISIDLGSFELVKIYRERICHLLSDFVDVVFANEEEALKFGGKNAEDSCLILSKHAKVAVVMLGEKGCLVGHDGQVTPVVVVPIKAIDTTGAGDLFASGFIHGQLLGRSFIDSAKMGALLGKTVVQIVGAEVPLKNWQQILKEMRDLYVDN